MQKYFDEVLLEEKITIYLLVLKIGPNLKGYTFIKEGTKKIVKDNSKKYKIRTGLYCEIAKENNVLPDLVDRAMRHAIGLSIKRGGIRDFEKTFDIEFSTDRPSPRELLCVLAEIVSIGKDLAVSFC